jgi:hypothetical protein
MSESPFEYGKQPVVPGDPFGGQKAPAARTSPPPEEVNRFHERSDVDSSALAQHHTLGVKHDQASPGDHNHNGEGSLFLMDGITITGSKGGNAALADLITKLAAALGFTDATT